MLPLVLSNATLLWLLREVASGSILNVRGTCVACAVGAAEHFAARLGAMTDDPAVAVFALGR
jgi:hypothetical protein